MLPRTVLSGDVVLTSIPAAVAVGLTETLAYVVLPSITLPDEVARPMPCRPLWWLVDPRTVTPVEADSRIPVDSDPATVTPVSVTPPPVHVSTSTPLLADCVAVTPWTVTREEESTRTPAKFWRRVSRFATTTSCWELTVTPNDWAPASTSWPSPGFAPPMSTYSSFAVAS